MDGTNGFNKLIVSLAGILIFISLAYFIDLNGFTSLSPVLIAAGVALLFYSDTLAKKIHVKMITKQIILTFSHIFIFVGGKVYLDQYVQQFWIIYLILGVVMLNKSRAISSKLKL